MQNFKIQTYLITILLISLTSIISAYYIEFFLGHQPCNLCLIERIPYILSIMLIILNYVFDKNEKFIILLLIMTFVFSFIISLYHLGIEQNFIQESALCRVKDMSELISKEELIKQLQIKNISCRDVTFRIFGFSLTTFNIIISLIILILLIKIYNNYEKFKS